MKQFVLLIAFLLPIELLSQSISLQITKMPIPLRKREVRDSTRNYLVIHNDGANLNAKTTHAVLRRRRLQYHYFIGRDGHIYEFVDPKYIAFHAGKSNYLGMSGWNDFSIGICLQGTNFLEYTEEQYQSLNDLVFSLRIRYPDIQNYPLTYHSQVAYPSGRKKDPGPHFDITKITIDTL